MKTASYTDLIGVMMGLSTHLNISWSDLKEMSFHELKLIHDRLSKSLEKKDS